MSEQRTVVMLWGAAVAEAKRWLIEDDRLDRVMILPEPLPMTMAAWLPKPDGVTGLIGCVQLVPDNWQIVTREDVL